MGFRGENASRRTMETRLAELARAVITCVGYPSVPSDSWSGWAAWAWSWAWLVAAIVFIVRRGW